MQLLPEQSETRRLERIPTLPIFFKLRGRRVLLAGGDPPAVWKAELLAAAGAWVEVVSLEPCAEMATLARTLGTPAVKLTRRRWSASDLGGAALAIGAFPDDGEAGRFQRASHAAGVPVNVIDKPDFCDFQFGTLIERSPLVIAITTDGAAPVFGQALRARIETLLPANLRAWAEAAQAWRPAVRARDWSFAKRRRFWEDVADRALRPDGPLPDASEQQACFEAADRQQADSPTEVNLIGCGSGRLDDLTFAAMRAMQNADLILCDRDVSNDASQIGRREASTMHVATDQEGLSAVFANRDRARRIVWLGTGNPAACPRWRRRHQAISRLVPVTETRGLDTCPRCAGRCTAPPSENNRTESTPR